MVARIERANPWVIGTLVGAVAGAGAAAYAGFWPVALATGLCLCAPFFLGRSVALPLLAWISVQNGIIPILWHFTGTSGSIWTLVLALPEVVTVSYLTVQLADGAVAPGALSRWSVAAAVYLLIAGSLAVVAHHDTSLFNRLLFVRGLAVPVLFLGMGYIYAGGKLERVHTLMVVVSGASVIGAVFVLADHFLVPVQFWNNLQLGAYWIEVKHWPASSVVLGLPGNMFEIYGSQVIRRAIGLYGDPLAAGYSLAIGFGALLSLSVARVHSGRRTGWLWLAMMLVGSATVFTYTRAAYGMVLVMLLFVLVFDPVWRASVSKVGLAAGAAGGAAVAGKVILDTIRGANSSVLVHIAAFRTVLPALAHPAGVGYLGEPEGAYTAVLWIAGPLALASMAAFLSTIRLRGNEAYSVGARAIFFALLVSGLASAEMFTDTACGAAWVIVGACLSWEARRALRKAPGRRPWPLWAVRPVPDQRAR